MTCRTGDRIAREIEGLKDRKLRLDRAIRCIERYARRRARRALALGEAWRLASLAALVPQPVPVRCRAPRAPLDL